MRISDWSSDVCSSDLLCKGGTQVNIRPSVDLPPAPGSVVANLVTGSDALKGVAINPALKVTFIQGSNFTVTLSPSVKLDDKGVAGAGGPVQVQKIGRAHV